MSSRVIEGAGIIIAVYGNDKIERTAAKYGRACLKKAKSAELLSAGAAVQNMFLTLNSIGLGGVWLDAPTLFEDKINRITKQKDSLLVLLVLGYPNQAIKRSYRNAGEMIKFL
jgi:nitroreductase